MKQVYSAMILVVLMLLLLAPAGHSVAATATAADTQQDGSIAAPVPSTFEAGIMPPAVPSVDNLPVPLRSPYPQRRSHALVWQNLHTPFRMQERRYRFAQPEALYTSPPVYLAVCLLLI